ncbi:uncharacterized protein (TIGR03086 family) [Isoptericola jiangsuensis]|uniref:Uncharacterized protein (TIGR03086 family) n=1 Tax=Isoptericola jiangsuensis TaxID=548579 RepID=A0A2A9ETM5_9MICO|nr:TIGR03086 family metal-binding protein [Isoptericola jiangsuensis]PFG41519.1 uncharacterized protein (TIGR03086 family) [Isoptericola jiangsuensis]
MFDLAPATDEMRRLVAGVRDDQLDLPTPCTGWTVADLLAHVHQLTVVFTANARKEPVRPPSSLVDAWRVAVPVQLDALACAWRAPTAWEGRVSAGGVDMDAHHNAVVAVEELTVHGWDLARATSQELVVDGTRLDHVEDFFDVFGEAPFGPAVVAPADASRLDRLVARTGRDPAWPSGDGRAVTAGR